MIKDVKYNAMNWVNGMKITRDHLITQENFFVDKIRDANSLAINSFNFGILPPAMSDDPNGSFARLEVRNTATQDIELVIQNCQILTSDGSRIIIDNLITNLKKIYQNPFEEEKKSQKNNDEYIIDDGNYFLVVSINVFERVAYGEIDTEETPTRHPYVKPQIKVLLISDTILNERTNGGNYIVLGKINMKSGIATIVTEFIPPVTAVISNRQLINFYNKFLSSGLLLRQLSIKILKKTHHKNQDDALAHNVKAICSATIRNMSNNYFKLRNYIDDLPPIYLVEVFSNFALEIYNEILLMPNDKVEEMLNYSMEWSSVKPHNLLDTITKLAEIEYNHLEIGECMLIIEESLDVLEVTLRKLSELDYIGQRKENVIVTQKEIKSKKSNDDGWSIID